MIEIVNYLHDIRTVIEQLDQERIALAIEWLHKARLKKSQIFVMGNGGSASTATHFTGDLNKNTRYPGLPDFRVTCLSDNITILMAYANDEGYENVFSAQLQSYCQPGDIVIGISTSGKSPNVIRALSLANQLNARTIGMTGFNGGKLRQVVDLELHVPSTCIEQVEDIHLILAHLFTKNLREMGQRSVVNDNMYRQPVNGLTSVSANL